MGEDESMKPTAHVISEGALARVEGRDLHPWNESQPQCARGLGGLGHSFAFSPTRTRFINMFST